MFFRHQYIIETTKEVTQTTYDPYTQDIWISSKNRLSEVYRTHSKSKALKELQRLKMNSSNHFFLTIIK